MLQESGGGIDAILVEEMGNFFEPVGGDRGGKQALV